MEVRRSRVKWLEDVENDLRELNVKALLEGRIAEKHLNHLSTIPCFPFKVSPFAT
jgi:hypothetical protein